MKNLLSFILIMCTSSLWAQVPDSTFGEPLSFGFGDAFYGVTLSTYTDVDDRAFASIHLDDGRILLGGHAFGPMGGDFMLTRLLPDGKYDFSAGPNGRMLIDLGYANDSCLAAVRHQDEWLIMAGCAKPPTQNGYRLLVARVNVDGQTDPNFGAQGHTLIDLPEATHEHITQLATLPDGKIIIAGNALYGPTYYTPDSTRIFLGRLLPNGQIDSTFGNNGFVFRQFVESCPAAILKVMVVDDQARILIGGDTSNPYPGTHIGAPFCQMRLTLARYLPDGERDTAFDNRAWMAFRNISNTPKTGLIKSIMVEPDGRILVSGLESVLANTRPEIAIVARLLPNGSIDSTFANNGIFNQPTVVNTAFTGPVSVFRIDDYYYLGLIDGTYNFPISFGLTRFSLSGERDLSFGDGTTFAQNGVFTSWTWLPFFGEIEQVTTIDGQSVFFTGYQLRPSGLDMLIAKVKLNTIVNSDSSPEDQLPELSVFPNPATQGRVYIQYPGQIAVSASARLLDMQGRALRQYPLSAEPNPHPLDVSGLPSGIYLLEVSSPEGRWTGKVVLP